ncbi:hypothetical protein COBT_002845 [Conglomerata obtusa]
MFRFGLYAIEIVQKHLFTINDVERVLISQKFTLNNMSYKYLGLVYGTIELKIYKVVDQNGERLFLGISYKENDYYGIDYNYLLKYKHVNIIKIEKYTNKEFLKSLEFTVFSFYQYQLTTFRIQQYFSAAFTFDLFQKEINLNKLMNDDEKNFVETYNSPVHGKMYLYQNFFRHALEALKYLHEYKICHRNINPESFLINENVLLLWNFNCAKHLLDQQNNDLLFDVIKYRAPETAKNKGFSCASDIWSLGVVFLELLIGKDIFTDQSNKSLILSHYHFFNENLLNAYYNEFMSKINIFGFAPIHLQFITTLNEVLRCCLCLLPEKRYEAKDLLNMKFFKYDFINNKIKS